MKYHLVNSFETTDTTDDTASGATIYPGGGQSKSNRHNVIASTNALNG